MYRHACREVSILVCVALCIGAVLLVSCVGARAACVPDTVTWTPTPTLQWDPVPDADLAGYRVYWRDGFGPFAVLVTLPCQPILDDDGATVVGRYCPGTDAPIALQRYISLEFENVEIVVRAYDTADNISANDSNNVFVCLPHIWIPGEIYSMATKKTIGDAIKEAVTSCDGCKLLATALATGSPEGSIISNAVKVAAEQILKNDKTDEVEKTDE
jgi:hypothetical protein